MAPWSSTGDPTAVLVKPDVVGPSVGILGAVPPAVRSTRWDVVSGTSAATAVTSGAALRLRAQHPGWSADAVRSALATTASPVRASSLLQQGAGLVDLGRADRPALAYLVEKGDYREWLAGGLYARDLNVPSLMLAGGATTVRRELTNVGLGLRRSRPRWAGWRRTR